MVILYSFVSILLLIAGGVGLFVTLTGADSGTTIWLQGITAFGAFIVIGVTILISLLTILVEHD